MISLVIPTYNEHDTIGNLLAYIYQYNPKMEVIVVDDNSPDGTGILLEKLKPSYENLKIVHRYKRMGLSSAVTAGFKVAKGDILGVMDADMSHPFELIEKLTDKIRYENKDIAIGSRYVKGGYVETFPFFRKAISKSATLMAKMLTDISDPMSGYFFMKRDVIQDVNFKSQGYKILLEVLVKGKYDSLAEVPYTFKGRGIGKSKLNSKEYAKYLLDWVKLVGHKIAKY